MSLLNDFRKKNILVVGDVMLDTYYFGEVKRISPEAPVPVFKKNADRSVLGGAGNVAANLVAAGQKVSIMATIGVDENGATIKRLFEQLGINVDLLVPLTKDTTVKTRFLANNNQQVMRLDVEDPSELSEEDGNSLMHLFEENIDQFDLILISDYLKGMLSYNVTQNVICMAKEKDIPVVIDVKDTNVKKYKGAFLIKPNLKELRDLTGFLAIDDKGIVEASEYLRRTCDCKYVLTTCGEKGMVLVGDEEPYFIPSVGQEVFDVTGAGDTTVSYLSACIANEMEIKQAVDVANIAAGLQVSKVGTSAIFLNEVREYLGEKRNSIGQKVVDWHVMETIRKDNMNKTIVFTNGCFDILHVGHVRYLQEASKLGDILIVGLNSDESVRRLKGPSRPINNEAERAELLASLSFVDYVVTFNEDTPYELISVVQPDILVKGGDYANEYVVGTDIVEGRGGKLVLIPFVEGKSTTNLIKKMQS